jgi:hypothetical protein
MPIRSAFRLADPGNLSSEVPLGLLVCGLICAMVA